jgi:soluble lytic murein transglycosylase
MPAGMLSQSRKKSPSSRKSSSSSKSKLSPKLRHINRAFTASTDLKPMAQQLLANRTPQAYAGVEAYARQHQKDDAAPLAWLVLGYAHYLDKDYAKAQSAWDHSAGLSPIVGDYLDYLRATAYHDAADPANVLKTLEGFERKYPDSLYIHEANLLYAGALTATGSPKITAVYLEKRREPVRADTELLLGRAYAAAGEKSKAAAIFRRIYFDMPLSFEAESAAIELRTLGEAQPVGNYASRKSRAAALLKGKRYQQAADEFSSLLEQAPPAELLQMQADYATALYHLHRRDDAQRLFETILKNASAGSDSKAQALYFLSEIAREKNDHDLQDKRIAELRTMAPESDWLQQALLSAANKYMLKQDFETASRWYTEIYQRKRDGRFSPYAHWKVAWLSYRMGKKDDARRLFEEQLEMYPASAEVPAAIYWRGRLAENDGNKLLARAYYQKLTENFRYYYYANLGRDRLNKLGTEGIVDPPALNRLPGPPRPPQNWDAPADNIRAQKAQLLANAALFDFAVKELQASASGSPTWQAESIAQTYNDAGSYARGIETLKRAVPGYFSTEIDQIPRPVWQALFPRPFWDDLKKHSQVNQLDPYLVASLIRQESEFNPGAISRANALGLMQLLPKVGKNVARELKLRSFSQGELFDPGVNMQLGTRYFRYMVDHYNGQVEYALAAYNAGEDRVDGWRKQGDFKDIDEFVESIPFTETREYVEAIMRNAVMYRLLYPKG